MKVLFFCNLVPDKPGAFERLLAEIARVSRERGGELVVASAANPAEGVRRWMEGSGTAWRTIPEWCVGGVERPWAFCQPALCLLRAERPDVAVVHFGNELPSLAVRWLASLTGIRGVRWVWQQDQQIQPPCSIARHVSRLGLLKFGFERFVAVYEGGRQSMIWRGIPAGRIAVVPNSVADHRRERAAGWLREEANIPGQAAVALTVSSLIPRKRVEFQIEALSRMKEGAPVVLVVAGDGPERSRLEELARARGVLGMVRFLGRRSDVRELLFEADVLLHTALAEASPYSFAEAMAAGVPIVATDAGAARELIEQGRTGWVVSREDAEGFATAVRQLVEDQRQRRDMGERARQRWQSRYRVESAAARYWEIYSGLAAG